MNGGEESLATARSIGLGRVVRLAWPITVSMLSYTVMLVVDTIYVGQLGTRPLAAIGLATAVTFVFVCFGRGAVQGMKIVVAQRTGAGEAATVARALVQGLHVAVGIGLLVAALAPWAEALFGVLGAGDDVAELAAGYLRVRLLGAVFTLSLVAANGWFEGRGDTRTPMVATLIANGLNIVLDPLLIFGWGPVPAMGIAGAAAATLLAEALALAWLWARLRRRHREATRAAWPEPGLLREILRLGLPMGVRGALEVSAWTVFIAILARCGDTALAAHVLVVRVVSVSFLPGHAIGEAAAVLVGQAVGAGRPELASQAWRRATGLAMGLMTACAVIFAAIPEVLLSVFGPAAEVVEIAAELMLIAAAFQLFDAVAVVAQGALNGAGDARFVMVSSVLIAWCFNVPVAWLLALELGLGATGAWLSLTAELVLIAAVSLHRIVRGRGWRVPARAAADEETRPLDLAVAAG